MNKRLTKHILFMLFALVLTHAKAQERKESYFWFTFNSRSQLDTLTQWMSIDHVQENRVYAYATPAQWQKLLLANLDVHQLPLPSENRNKSDQITMASTPEEMESWDKYPTYGCYQALMKAFNAHDLCKVYSIGKSSEERNIYIAEISGSTENKHSKPGIFLTSTMHGDETTGYILMLRLIDSLLKGYPNSTEIKTLLDSNTIYINPLANPDGTYREGDYTVEGASRYNANMVDLNRNFPDPTGDSHPDQNAHQPETKIMMGWTDTTSIAMAANFHGGAEVVNYPWDVYEHLHPDDQWFINYSLSYASLAQANGPYGYFTSVNENGISNGYQWYQVFGSRQDFMNYHRQIKEVTIEVSSTKLLPSASLPDFWHYNKEALFALMNYSKWGLFGKVTDIAKNPIEAEIFLQNYDTQADSSMVFSNSQTGYFARLLPSGTYDMEIKSAWHRDSLITDIVLDDKTKRYFNIKLTPLDTVAFSGKIYSAADGNVLPDVRVNLTGENQIYVAFTNEQGTFQFSQLPAQEYQLTLQANGHKTHQSALSLSESNLNYTNTLETGEATSFSLSGIIRNALNGTSIQDAELQFELNGQTIAETKSNSSGVYEVGSLTTGRYLIHIYHPSFRTLDTLAWIDEAHNTLNFNLMESENTNTKQYKDQLFRIYPNPSKGDLYVQMPWTKDEIADAYVYNLKGQLLLTISGDSKTLLPIDTSSLPEGLYVFVVRTTQKSYSTLFFKE